MGILDYGSQQSLVKVSLHVYIDDLAAMHRIIAIDGNDLHSFTNGQASDDGH